MRCRRGRITRHPSGVNGAYVDTRDVWHPGTVQVMQQIGSARTASPSRAVSSCSAATSVVIDITSLR
uniref:Uncharacterized protein n=1 Tax=Nonomuraea sp. MJM5123 TaxID=1562372 RepID=A0A1R7SQL5_9ACTN|nr:hypothetical protein [Nonomuraea sp. MJM5123]